MKKVLIAVLAPLLASAAFGQSLLPTGPASYSGTAALSINDMWSGTAAPSAIQFSWAASGGASVTGITLGSAATSATKILQCSGTFPQLSGTCLVWGLNSNTMANGAIAVTAISPTSNASITITTSAISAADVNGTAIASTGGTLTIPFVNKCDLDGSGTVDVSDVTIAGQHILATPQITPCDFDKTGKCDLFDLLVILKAALGGACSVAQ